MLSKLELSLCVILIFLTLFSPEKYSYGYVLSAFLITIFGVVAFFISWHRKGLNFMQFEPVFVCVALIVGFTFPLLIYAYDENTAYVFSWNIPYSLNYINKGACLNGVGITAFLAGCTKKVSMIRKRRVSNYGIIGNSHIIFPLLFLLFLFTVLGGFERYQSIYHGEDYGSSYLTYIEVFIIALSQVIIANEVWNKLRVSKYMVNKKSIALVLTIALLYLYVGNRTIALYLLLPLLFFFSSFKYKVSFVKFILLIFIGGVFMVLVQFFRSGSQYNEGLDWYYNMADLMIPNTTTYLACEIVDKTGFTYGVSMLGSVLGAIPFLQSLLNMLIGLEGDVTNSSHIFTKFLGSQDGTGTSFVSDSYLAFGIMGVLVVSYYSGVIISYLKERSRDSYYHLVMYIVYCGFAIYAVRSSFLFPIRFITYSVLFAYINIKLFKYDRINHHTRI